MPEERPWWNPSLADRMYGHLSDSTKPKPVLDDSKRGSTSPLGGQAKPAPKPEKGK
jgi:hypothetical protein